MKIEPRWGPNTESPFYRAVHFETLSLPGLNQGQCNALSSSLGRDITFIWGPPGTGKTHTIGTVAEQLFQRGRSVLLVSHTNTAVDQAILHIAKAFRTSAATASFLDAGRVLRVGEPRTRRFLEQPELLAETHVERRCAELAERRSADLEVTSASTEASQLSRTHRLVRMGCRSGIRDCVDAFGARINTDGRAQGRATGK